MKKKVLLTGDSILMRRGLINNTPGSRELHSLIKSADVSFTNLECLPANYEGYPTKDSGGAHFGCRDVMLDELTEYGFNLFSAANNHSLNYGVTGLEALLKQLRRRHLAFSGIGENLRKAQQPVYLDTVNGSVSLLSFSSTYGKGQEASAQRPELQGRPGLNPLEFSTVYEVEESFAKMLTKLNQRLGLEQRRRREVKLGFEFPPDDPSDVPFLEGTFRPSHTNQIRTSCSAETLSSLRAWVAEAKRRSDIAIVSVHSHEQGEELTDPAEFFEEFAHHAIDYGADVVIGHGPHFLKPLEIYRAKPIFYSLGNFIGQNELVEQLPADSYNTFRIDAEHTPSVIFDTRTEGDTKGFPSEDRYWKTVVPVLTFDNDTLEEILVYPVTLGLGSAPQLRGKPCLAVNEQGAEILTDFQALCDQHPRGAEGHIDNDVLRFEVTKP
jgi:poly-gamma-glutamate capsule biosynthesis protein CapA/YwtB (metallophosphatase superfamily)